MSESTQPESTQSEKLTANNDPIFALAKQLSTSPKNMFLRIFKAADLNDDGKISLDELNCFLDIIVVVQQRMKVASEFLQELDDNADGSIELDEWMDYNTCENYSMLNFTCLQCQKNAF